MCGFSLSRCFNILNEQNIVPILLAAFLAVDFPKQRLVNRAYMTARSQFDRNSLQTMAEIEHGSTFCDRLRSYGNNTSVSLGVGVSSHMQIAFLRVYD